MFCWVEDHKNANSKNRFIVHRWLTMVLWMRVFKSTSWMAERGEEPRLLRQETYSGWADLVKIIHISETFSLAWLLIKMRKCQDCECWHQLARTPDSISWNRSILNVSCSWLVCFPIGIIIVVSESCSNWGPGSQQMTRVTASLLMKGDKVNFIAPGAKFYTMRTVYLEW